MFEFIGKFLDWLKSLFWKEEMELTLIGLQNSGKTTFVNVIAVSLIINFFFDFFSKLFCIQILTYMKNYNLSCYLKVS